MDGSTLTKIVGSTNQPRSSPTGRPPPRTTLAPSSRPEGQVPVEIGVVEDDGGGLAPELQGGRLHLVAAGGGDLAAGFTWSPQVAAIWRPATVLPVKVTMSTPGCDTSACPTATPPGRTLNSPVASPASSNASASR